MAATVVSNLSKIPTTVNPDLQVERDKSPLTPHILEITNLIDGSHRVTKRRREIGKMYRSKTRTDLPAVYSRQIKGSGQQGLITGSQKAKEIGHLPNI
jgi:hypothetical protein